MNQRSREAAYADLVSGLVDARIDVASDRFDAELENAEASGRLDPATARLLRWWQRESVRAVTEHARTTIPVTLVALERAQKEAQEAVHRADAAWTTARGVTARSNYGPDVPPAPAPSAPLAAPAPTAPETVAPEPVEQAPAVPEPAAPTAPTAPTQPGPPPAPWSTTVAPPQAEPTWTTLEPPNYPGDPTAQTQQPQQSQQAVADRPAADAPAPTAEAAYPTAPGEAPSIVDLTAHEESVSPTATPAPGRRRTLLAGLTVLPRTD